MVKDNVAKRTEEIIFHVECEKSVQIRVKSHELLEQQELKHVLVLIEICCESFILVI